MPTCRTPTWRENSTSDTRPTISARPIRDTSGCARRCEASTAAASIEDEKHWLNRSSEFSKRNATSAASVCGPSTKSPQSSPSQPSHTTSHGSTPCHKPKPPSQPSKIKHQKCRSHTDSEALRTTSQERRCFSPG